MNNIWIVQILLAFTAILCIGIVRSVKKNRFYRKYLAIDRLLNKPSLEVNVEAIGEMKIVVQLAKMKWKKKDQMLKDFAFKADNYLELCLARCNGLDEIAGFMKNLNRVSNVHRTSAYIIDKANNRLCGHLYEFMRGLEFGEKLTGMKLFTELEKIRKNVSYASILTTQSMFKAFKKQCLENLLNELKTNTPSLETAVIVAEFCGDESCKEYEDDIKNIKIVVLPVLKENFGSVVAERFNWDWKKVEKV